MRPFFSPNPKIKKIIIHQKKIKKLYTQFLYKKNILIFLRQKMEAPQFWTGGVWIKRVLDGPIRTERKKSQSLLYQSTPQRQRPKAERVEVEGQVRNSIHDFFPLFFRFSSLCFCSSLKSRVGLGF